jgi:branched-chain amino acid transport system substrate-binding protein
VLLLVTAAVALGATAGGSTAPSAPSWVATALRYTGGSAGAADPKRPPIYVGFVSQQGATPSYPESLAAATAAIRFVDAKLGGVRGRPLRIAACMVQSTAVQLRACAQQFL